MYRAGLIGGRLSPYKRKVARSKLAEGILFLPPGEWGVSFATHGRQLRVAGLRVAGLVCELLILLLFFPVEWLFSLFVLVQLLKCCEHRA